jgi:hypothetical protein
MNRRDKTEEEEGIEEGRKVKETGEQNKDRGGRNIRR